jgi:hypothetical protein
MLGEEAIIVEVVSEVPGEEPSNSASKSTTKLSDDTIHHTVVWRERLYSAAWTCFRLLTAQCITNGADATIAPLLYTSFKSRRLQIPAFSGRSYSYDKITSPSKSAFQFSMNYDMNLSSPMSQRLRSIDTDAIPSNRERSLSLNAWDDSAQKLLQHNSLKILSEEVEKASKSILYISIEMNR